MSITLPNPRSTLLPAVKDNLSGDQAIKDYLKSLVTSIEDAFTKVFDNTEFLSSIGIHRSNAITYISGTGTAGADNTAQTVYSATLLANTLTQVGDRMRIRTYWKGDTGGAITGTIKLGPASSEVTISHTTDGGGATLQLNESWLHFIDNTHANIIENEAGSLGALSAANVAGFNWGADQSVIFTQDQVVNNHTILYALIVDVFPKGLL